MEKNIAQSFFSLAQDNSRQGFSVSCLNVPSVVVVAACGGGVVAGCIHSVRYG